MRRWARDLAFGLRLALSGGSGPRLRAALTAVGVGLGVAMLLAATAVPNVIRARDDRLDARAPEVLSSRAGAPLLGAFTETNFAGKGIGGLTLQALRAQAPVPPGLRELPRPGEMYVSPALRDLLDEPGSALLRRRLPGRIAGVIGDAGLESPAELQYIAGTDQLRGDARALGFSGFGVTRPSPNPGPLFTLLVLVMAVVLLLPVAMFVSTAVRFGGGDRERRLAALRLAGADRAMTARIAAGETLLGAGAGIGVGAALFLLGRPLVERIRIGGIAVFGADIRPSTGLAVIILALVPLTAVLATLAALRGVAIEPLGVSRRVRPPRRRLWWRLLPTALGLALLWPFMRRIDALDDGAYRAAAGILLVLVGTAAVLPWAVDAVVRRAPAGPLPWQLAVRRLRVDGGTGGRVVSAVAVAVAGAVALQTVFAAVEESTSAQARANPSQPNMTVMTRAPAVHAERLLARTPGVQWVTVRRTSTTGFGESAQPGETSVSLRYGARDDAEDQVRTALARLDPLARVTRLTELDEFGSLRRALLFASAAVLAMIGAAQLVAAVEQLRERRRALAVLAAFGTPRTTLAWSVAWQAALPVTLGLALALGTGVLLGGVLLTIADVPLRFDWGAIAALIGVGGAVVLGVTLLSLPVLLQLARPEALRVE